MKFTIDVETGADVPGEESTAMAAELGDYLLESSLVTAVSVKRVDDEPEWHVEWHIDLPGEDAEHAARLALETLRDPESIATVFTVTRAGEAVNVDLAEFDGLNDL